MRLGVRQLELVELLKKGHYVSVFDEIGNPKRIVTLMDKYGNEVDKVRESLVSSLVKKNVCKIELVHSTTMPDTETLKITLK